MTDLEHRIRRLAALRPEHATELLAAADVVAEIAKGSAAFMARIAAIDVEGIE